MTEIDTKDQASLRHASIDELVKDFKKWDHYFEYGPRCRRHEYLERISTILGELRNRKNGSNGELASAFKKVMGRKAFSR